MPRLVTFDPATADLDRPCTLIAERDAEALLGKPFYDAIAMNRMDGARTRCALAVGGGGLMGVMQLDVYASDDKTAATARYGSLCRLDATAPPTAAPMACVTLDGGYAALLHDRVYVALVRSEALTNQALSLRLINLVAPRIDAAADQPTR